jgi:hypothetical protein
LFLLTRFFASFRQLLPASPESPALMLYHLHGLACLSPCSRFTFSMQSCVIAAKTGLWMDANVVRTTDLQQGQGYLYIQINAVRASSGN